MHYVTWSEQRKIEIHAPEYLRNIVRIITETGLRVYKELMPMKKEHLDLTNAVVWITICAPPTRHGSVPGGVADEWVTQLLRQGDVFKKYSQMKLQMKREALVKLNRMANEQNSVENPSYDTARVN